MSELLSTTKVIKEGEEFQAAGGQGYPDNTAGARQMRKEKGELMMAALARCKEEFYHEADDQQRKFLKFAADQAEAGSELSSEELINIYIEQLITSDSKNKMDGKQMREAIEVEKERLREVAREKARIKKNDAIEKKAKAADPMASSSGRKKEPVFGRNKKVEPMPTGIRVIEDDGKRAEKLNQVMGGEASKLKHSERAALNRIHLDKMFGKGGRDNYTAVPPPEFYTTEEWEAEHRDAIEENLFSAESRFEIEDELHAATDHPEDETEVNCIDEVD